MTSVRFPRARLVLGGPSATDGLALGLNQPNQDVAGLMIAPPVIVPHYLNIPAGGGAHTPDIAALNSGTATLDFRVKLAPNAWAPGGVYQALFAQVGTAATSRWLYAIEPAGSLFMKWWGAGAVQANHSSSVNPSTRFADGNPGWLRALVTVAAGTTDFYTSPPADGVAWTPLGAQQTFGGTVALNNTTPPIVNTGTDNFADVAAGKLYRSILIIGGVTVFDMDFSTATPGTGPWTASTGEVWTRQGTSVVV